MEVSFAGKIIELNGAFSGKPCWRTPEGNSMKSPLSPLVSMGCLSVSPLRLRTKRPVPKAISSTGNYIICQRQFPSSHFLAKLRTEWQDLGNQVTRPLGNVAHLQPSLYMGHVGMAGGNPEAIRMDLSKHQRSFPYCQYSSCFRLPGLVNCHITM